MQTFHETDFSKSHQTIRNIRQVKDDTPASRIGFIETLSIIEWALMRISEIFFSNKGKVKSWAALLLVLPKIIGFIIELTRMINSKLEYKPKHWEVGMQSRSNNKPPDTAK